MRDSLLQEISQKMKIIGKAITLRHGEDIVCISPALDQVVMIIGSEEEINVKHLAKILMVTSGAATQHIAALEKQGILRRIPSKEDRREVMICLTPKGEEVYKEIKATERRLLEELFGDLDNEELVTFVALLTKASKQYDK